MNANSMLIWSVALLALAVLVMGGATALRAHRNERAEQRMEAALKERSGAVPWRPIDPMADEEGSQQESFTVPGHWLSGKVGQALLADEDRKLIDICGTEPAKGQSVFFVARVVLGLGLPLAAFVLFLSLIHI